MKYMGSKNRFAKDIIKIMLQNRKNSLYIEPFCGGCNVIDKVENLQRIANDNNFYLIEMWKKLVEGWIPTKIDKEMYVNVKNNKDNFPPYLVGWIGFNCSYSGKFFGGFAGSVFTKINTIRDYQMEAIANVTRQVKKLQNVQFLNKNYYDLEIPDDSVVYCDPPYEDTTKYHTNFDHQKFWDWIRKISMKNHVYISEYAAPKDFCCIWSKRATSSLSANGKIGGNEISIEKLFKLSN